jgi:hypothetical protein
MRAGIVALGVAIVIVGGTCVVLGVDTLLSAYHRGTSVMDEEFAYVDGNEYSIGRAILVVGAIVGPQGFTILRIGRMMHPPGHDPSPWQCATSPELALPMVGENVGWALGPSQSPIIFFM